MEWPIFGWADRSRGAFAAYRKYFICSMEDFVFFTGLVFDSNIVTKQRIC
jgi:hypothetical protein